LGTPSSGKTVRSTGDNVNARPTMDGDPRRVHPSRDGLGQANVAFANAIVVIFERLPAPQAAPA